VLEAIDQTLDEEQLASLGDAALALAAGLEPDQAGRAFDYVVDLLDWANYPGRRSALGLAALGLVQSLAPARVGAGLEQVMGAMERAGDPLQLQLLGRLAAALVARLDGGPRGPAVEILLAALDAPGTPARSHAFGMAALGFGLRLENGRAGVADRLLATLSRRDDFGGLVAAAMALAGMAPALDAGLLEQALVSVLNAVDAIPRRAPPDEAPIAALVRAASGLASALPVARAAAVFDLLLLRLVQDTAPFRLAVRARLGRALAETGITPDVALTRQALRAVLAGLAGGHGDHGELARAAAALAGLGDETSGAEIWQALKSPHSALGGVTGTLIEALRPVTPDLSDGRQTGYWAFIERLEARFELN